MQAKLEARNFKVAKRLSLWTRAERRLKQSKWSGKRPNNIVNLKAREELIGMQDHIFRQLLPTHAREAYELQMQMKQRKLQADQCRQKERQEWYDRHKPSVIFRSVRDLLQTRYAEWHEERHFRAAKRLAEEEEARQQAAEAAEKRRHARREDQR